MPPPPGTRRATRGLSWPRSLYGRAVLAVVIGSGCVVGAALVQSARIVEDSVDRLLEERIDVARMSGSYVENRVTHDLERLTDAVAGVDLTGCTGPAECPPIRAVLATQYRSTIFEDGAFFLDTEGRPLAAVPDPLDYLRGWPELTTLVAEARARGGPVTSALRPLPGSRRRALVILAPSHARDGHMLGFVGGLLQPADTALLSALGLDPEDSTMLELVDREGVVVASTQPETLFLSADHDSVLTRAIDEHRELRSRCHSCHETGHDRPSRRTEVLAFAPLPTLELGVAVRQPEAEALQPAFALRRRLLTYGSLMVGMFLLFTGIAVHSVVRPLTRLTQVVRRVEASGGRIDLPPMGADEAGELARALQRWNARLMASLEAEEQHRTALRDEIVATQMHLTALREIAELYAQQMDIWAVLRLGLSSLSEVLGYPVGALEVTHRGDHRAVQRRWTGEEAQLLLADCHRRLTEADPLDPSEPGAAQRPRVLELFGDDAAEIDPALRGAVIAELGVPQGLRLFCVLADQRDREPVKRPRLHSLLHQIVTGAASGLLQQEALLRQEMRRKYLRRVLNAQESERRRIARELHDTVAQDMAAHRLGLERMTRQDLPEPVAADLRALEEQAHDMLFTVRRILFDLRLSVLENMGFLPALQSQLERIARDRGVRVTLSVDGKEEELGYELAVTLFRIFQECVQNAIHHGHPSLIFVTVAYAPHHVELIVEDDGCGFEPAKLDLTRVSSGGRGLGLLGMEERAKLLRGELEVTSKPGEGTMVRASIPRPTVERPANEAIGEST